MNISTSDWLKGRPGYNQDCLIELSAALMAGMGHKADDKTYTATDADINACMSALDQSDANIDPFCYTVALFSADDTAEKQHATKIKNNHTVRLLLGDLRRVI